MLRFVVILVFNVYLVGVCVEGCLWVVDCEHVLECCLVCLFRCFALVCCGFAVMVVLGLCYSFCCLLLGLIGNLFVVRFVVVFC